MSVAFSPRHDRTGSPVTPTVLMSLLEQLRDVVALMPVHCYRAQPAARVSGSIGAHVRHTVDHVSALVAAVEGEELHYDHRRRGTTVEVDPLTGMNEIERAVFRLRRIDAAALDRPVAFATLLDADQPAVVVRSTFARELAFVIQHTVHHCALIALLLEWQGYSVPRHFGVAASTRQARALAG